MACVRYTSNQKDSKPSKTVSFQIYHASQSTWDLIKTPVLDPNESCGFIEVKLENLHYQQIPGEADAMDQGTRL